MMRSVNDTMVLDNEVSTSLQSRSLMLVAILAGVSAAIESPTDLMPFTAVLSGSGMGTCARVLSNCIPM